MQAQADNNTPFPLSTLQPDIMQQIWMSEGRTFAAVRSCGICDQLIGYVYDGGALRFDTSCGCASSYPSMVGFEDLYRRIMAPDTHAARVAQAQKYGFNCV